LKKSGKYIFLVVLCFLFNQGYSQKYKTQIDSLVLLINKSSEDSNKVNLYFELARRYDIFKSKENDENNIKALKLAEKIDFKRGINRQYVLLITNFFYRGVYDLAMAYQLEYEKFLKENNLEDDLFKSYNMYGNLLTRQKKYAEASKYYHLAKQFHLSKNNQMGYANVLNNLVLLNYELNENDSALLYSYRAIEIYKKNNAVSPIANSILGVSEILVRKRDFENAESRARESYDIYNGINETHGMSNCLYDLGLIYSQTNRNDSALKLTNASLKLAIEINIDELERNCYLQLSDINRNLGNYKDAYTNYVLYKQMNDSLALENLQGKMLEMEVTYHVSKVNIELSEEKRQRSYLMVGILLIAIMFAVSLYAFIQKKKSSLIIAEQKKLVEEKQKEVLDSIHYAKRIQNTLIANKEFISANIPSNFILFKPKDIVSGDFYWATKHNNKFYLAVCDSTGHGVPGAFMSLLNITFLNEAINEKNISKPSEIFDYVRKKLIKNLGKEGQKDGFDGILLCIDFVNASITYAAANNSPIIISNGEIKKLPCNKMPVGYGERDAFFDLFQLQYSKGDVLYLYTDGFADQFGGITQMDFSAGGKKYKYKKLNELLLSINHQPPEVKVEHLSSEFETWKGNLEQTDDVTILGISL